VGVEVPAGWRKWFKGIQYMPQRPLLTSGHGSFEYRFARWKWPWFWDLRSSGMLRRAIGCPETSVSNYQSTLRNIPEERRPYVDCGRGLKPGYDFLCWYLCKEDSSVHSKAFRPGAHKGGGGGTAPGRPHTPKKNRDLKNIYFVLCDSPLKPKSETEVSWLLVHYNFKK
jgi:hypothetical protein